MRILLIDDDPAVTDILFEYLERQYLTPFSLNFFRSREDFDKQVQDFAPEGVILDFEMPGHDGCEVYTWIKAWNASVPIVFYTQYARSAEKTRRMREAGAKPGEIVQKQEVGSDMKSLLNILQAA